MPLLRRLIVLLSVVALAAGLSGCGKDTDTLAAHLKQEAQQRADRLRADAEQRIDRIRKRIEDVLGQMRQSVPQAQRTSPAVRGRGQTTPETIDHFLTRILGTVDDYWTRTLAASDLPKPHVFYDWVPPGATQRTGCGVPADDNAAFYCPSDDTMYVAQRFAADLYRGALRNLPGEQEGFGRAKGEFGVAYVVAHEYAHNIQNELGWFRLTPTNQATPFELQADCMAGTWGNSVYASGRYTDKDVQDAVDTALAVGDFDYASANHHGTPQERADAWLLGFRGGDPSACSRYLPT